MHRLCQFQQETITQRINQCTYFWKTFTKVGKNFAQVANHQAELRMEGKFTDQKYLSISSLQTDYQNLDNSSYCGKNSEREKKFQTKCTFFGGANHSAEKYFKNIRKEKEKAREAGDSEKKRT